MTKQSSGQNYIILCLLLTLYKMNVLGCHVTAVTRESWQVLTQSNARASSNVSTIFYIEMV